MQNRFVYHVAIIISALLVCEWSQMSSVPVVFSNTRNIVTSHNFIPIPVPISHVICVYITGVIWSLDDDSCVIVSSLATNGSWVVGVMMLDSYEFTINSSEVVMIGSVNFDSIVASILCIVTVYWLTLASWIKLGSL